jgi:hypothetical protein
MRYKLSALIFVVFAASLISLGFAEACIDAQISKSSYLPQETLQLEIDADVSYDIKASDISLYRDSMKLPTEIFLAKISATKWVAWLDLPSQSGNYSIKIKGTCKTGMIQTEEKDFEVLESLALRYETFKAKIGLAFERLPIETHILAAGVLSSDEVASEALRDYTLRSDSCMESICSTKNVALTLIALKDSLIKQKMYAALEAYQNYAQGAWQLQLDSASGQTCNVTIAGNTTTLQLSSGKNFINITLASPRVEVECEKNISGKIIYAYNSVTRPFEIPKVAENKLSFALDSGCWGTGLKNSCDTESTAYALLALALTNHFDQNDSTQAAALSWLKGNILNTEEKAIVYFLTKDSALLVQILNDQALDGWWPKSTLYEPDTRATTLALFALKSTNSNDPQTLDAISKADIWLRAREPRIADEAFMLMFAFPSSEIEPVMAFWPGLIKTPSRGAFDLILSNKGATAIEVNATLLNSTTPISLPKGITKKIHFDVPIVSTLDARALFENLMLSYRSASAARVYNYNIPTLIFTEKSSQEYTGNMTANESAINASQQQVIIDTTVIGNKTADINVSLFTERFKFTEPNITIKAYTADKSSTKTITLTNALDKDLSNIEINPSITLQTLPEIIKISPSQIETLPQGGTTEITLQINPAVMPQSYKGFIQATAYYGSTPINTTIPITINITKSVTELKNCDELNGTICEETMECGVVLTEALDTDNCCVPKEECKKKTPKGRTLGLVIVAVVVIVLILVLTLLRRKPKKEMKEFLEESTKAYEKKFQRPPSISH